MVRVTKDSLQHGARNEILYGIGAFYYH